MTDRHRRVCSEKLWCLGKSSRLCLPQQSYDVPANALNSITAGSSDARTTGVSGDGMFGLGEQRDKSQSAAVTRSPFLAKIEANGFSAYGETFSVLEPLTLGGAGIL
jgi:hypothetical protein